MGEGETVPNAHSKRLEPSRSMLFITKTQTALCEPREPAQGTLDDLSDTSRTCRSSSQREVLKTCSFTVAVLRVLQTMQRNGSLQCGFSEQREGTLSHKKKLSDDNRA